MDETALLQMRTVINATMASIGSRIEPTMPSKYLATLPSEYADTTGQGLDEAAFGRSTSVMPQTSGTETSKRHNRRYEFTGDH